LSDDPDRRRQAAREYLATVPIVRDLFEQGFAAVPDISDEERRRHAQAWAARSEAVERLIADALVATFTADEIEALTRFQGSPEGRVIMRKIPTYSATVATRMQALAEAVSREVYGE